MAEIDENTTHQINSLMASTRNYWSGKRGHFNFYYGEQSKAIHMERHWDTFVGQRVRHIPGFVTGLYNACMLCHKGFRLPEHFKKY